MKTIKFIFFAVLTLSCKERSKNVVGVQQNSNQLFDGFKEPDYDTIYIDYVTNKKKLEILAILPDSCFSSWGWKKSERLGLLEDIRSKGYTIDTTPDFLNINSIKENYFGCQVVDGYWEFSIYRVKEDNYIIITNDVVGDGNTINLYEYTNKTLKSIESRQGYFEKPLEQLRLKSIADSCSLKLDVENEEAIFRYNLEKLNEVEINNAWGFTRKDFSNCLKGNTLKYKFNPLCKKFELYEIKWNKKDYWKP